jgi:hypothetical protein
MSLLATAFDLKHENIAPTKPKKRVSSVGMKSENTIPARNTLVQSSPPDSDDDSDGHGFEGMNEYNSSKNERVSQLLDKITRVDAFSAGDSLADYNPAPRPATMMSQTPIHPARIDAMTSMSARIADIVPPQPPKPMYSKPFPQPDYMPNVVQPHAYSNYHQVYSAKPTYQPHAAAPRANMLASDERIMEKLNYLIHLMEEQQVEKTNNVMEEFLLYCLLGVFMIYTVDSFTRAGKYTR